MSPRRVVVLLVAGLAIVAGASWLSTLRNSQRAVPSGETVLPELKKALNDVTEVRFSKADGSHSTLRRQGTDWLVVERGYAADASRVRKLLLDAAAMEVVEEKTSNPARYAEISVEDVAAPGADAPVPAKPPKENPYDFSTPVSATRIDIVTPNRTWSLINGASAGSKSGYVRIVDAKQSLLASPRLDADADPQRWLDRTIADLSEARMQSVAVKPAKGPAYTVSRAKREDTNFAVADIPKGRKLSYEGVANSLAGGLESLSMDDVRDASTAAPAANVTVERSSATFRTFDGVTVEISGRKESAPGLKKDDPKVEHFFITLAASSTDKATQPEAAKLAARTAGKEFEISSYKYEGLFKPLDDLLEALPEKNPK